MGFRWQLLGMYTSNHENNTIPQTVHILLEGVIIGDNRIRVNFPFYILTHELLKFKFLLIELRNPLGT